MLKTYGVTLNLSGHVHIQHIAEYEGIHDIATGSLSVSPTQYGVLSISPQGTIIYETRTVGVADWDSKKGKTAQDFAVMARECFDQCGRKKMKKELEALPIPEEQKNAMIELALEMNRNYFAGTPMRKEEVTERPAWKLWSEAGAEFFFKTYMDSMMADEGKEQNYLILDMLPAAKRP